MIVASLLIAFVVFAGTALFAGGIVLPLIAANLAAAAFAFAARKH